MPPPRWRACKFSLDVARRHTFRRKIRLIRKNVSSGNWIAIRKREGGNDRVPIAKITGQGLAVIGFSVALLWGCVIGERAMVRQAYTERARVLRDIERWQRRQQRQPVSVPVPQAPRPIRITAG